MRKTTTGKNSAFTPPRRSDAFYLAGWRRAFDLTGVASREEYWSFGLINCAIAFLVYIAWLLSTGGQEANIFTVIWFGFVFAVIWPQITVTIRRVRDAAGNGWPSLLMLVPALGWTVVLVICWERTRAASASGDIAEIYVSGWRSVFDILGLATRTEFWTIFLINYAAFAVLGLCVALFFPPLTALIVLVIFWIGALLATLTATIRRARDATGSGWWSLLALLLVLGWFILVVILLFPSRKTDRL